MDQTAKRLKRLLGDLTHGKAKRDITPGQAEAILATIRPRDLVGRTRRRLARRRGWALLAVNLRDGSSRTIRVLPIRPKPSGFTHSRRGGRAQNGSGLS